MVDPGSQVVGCIGYASDSQIGRELLWGIKCKVYSKPDLHFSLPLNFSRYRRQVENFRLDKQSTA